MTPQARSALQWWRHALLALLVAGSLGALLAMEPFGQDLGYHALADRRAFFGVPNFLDVVSNVPFLLVGVAGFAFCLSRPGASQRSAWAVFFLGVALVSAGSIYYHEDPNDRGLVWDRLPMTIGFMGLFAALLGEYVSARLGASVLAPAVLLGLLSVLWWRWFDDLRFYAWIQLVPLLTVPALLVLFRSRYTHQWMLLAALGLYGLAKVSERYDQALYSITGNLFSGHTLKHLLAAASCYVLLVMLRSRKETC